MSGADGVLSTDEKLQSSVIGRFQVRFAFSWHACPLPSRLFYLVAYYPHFRSEKKLQSRSGINVGL